MCAQAYAHATWTMIWRHPWVFIAPLICLAALLTAGIMGVTAIADTIAVQRQDDARSEAQVRSVVIADKLTRALLPTRGLANYVRETPGYDWPTIEAVRGHAWLSMQCITWCIRV